MTISIKRIFKICILHNLEVRYFFSFFFSCDIIFNILSHFREKYDQLRKYSIKKSLNISCEV